MKTNSERWEPEYLIPPGETVLETISELGISQAELAARTGRPKKTINEIIRGKAAITPETALQLEKVLGVPASFWDGLEQRYRGALARAEERNQLGRQLDWLSQFPVRELVKRNWIPSFPDPVRQLEAILAFYGVASVDAWREIWSDLPTVASYRQAKTFRTDFVTATAWLRRGEQEARQIETRPFDERAFRKVLATIRSLTLDASTVFVKPLVELCASAGVAVCFVPELPSLRVCGATRWLTPAKAILQLSLRYKTNDQLWFTFFHEAGHILLHGKRSIFIEEVGGSARVSTGRTEPQRDVEEEEEEANRFAQDMLIPPEKYVAFVSQGDFSADAIAKLAREVGIHPGIVLGRLQRERHVPFPTNLNRLFKHSYRFVEA